NFASANHCMRCASVGAVSAGADAAAGGVACAARLAQAQASSRPRLCSLSRIAQASPLPASRPNDGGRSSGAAPNFLLGLSPISNTSVPPAARSAWLIQLFDHGLPFHVTDWM